MRQQKRPCVKCQKPTRAYVMVQDNQTREAIGISACLTHGRQVEGEVKADNEAKGADTTIRFVKSLAPKGPRYTPRPIGPAGFGARDTAMRPTDDEVSNK